MYKTDQEKKQIMTKQELNRDIKRLANNHHSMEEADVKNEIKRLYYADSTFEYMNLNSVKMLLRLNLRYRVISLHVFGLHIDLPNELN